eukprot:746615-Hanusia_phi.AAC.3
MEEDGGWRRYIEKRLRRSRGERQGRAGRDFSQQTSKYANHPQRHKSPCSSCILSTRRTHPRTLSPPSPLSLDRPQGSADDHRWQHRSLAVLSRKGFSWGGGRRVEENDKGARTRRAGNGQYNLSRHCLR